ncbi:MAG: SusE domain-containing protein [Flavobacteriaceae bacterium]|nr:SusE domain-containing protein [Flavobacteriaceae bacterium]
MKKNLFIFSLLAVGFFTACEDDDTTPLAAIQEVPELISPTSSTNVVITAETVNNVVQTFIWSPADFGFPTQVNYTVQIATAGTDFADLQELGITTNTFLEVTGEQLNGKLLSMGFVPGEPASLDTRVIAAINNETFKTAPTETVTFTVTPFTTEIILPKIYVPGNYQAASGWVSDWTPDQAPALVSANDDDKYEGYVFFNVSSAEFKFTDAPDWNNGVFGDSAGGFTNILATPPSQGDNMILFTSGVHRVRADLANLTWSAEPTNWGMIGSAIPVTGWDSDHDMTYDAVNHVLTITMDLIAGEIKFRANDDWAINFGDKDTDGVLDFNDNTNIPIPEAGNYTVIMDLKDSSNYNYVVTKN